MTLIDSTLYLLTLVLTMGFLCVLEIDTCGDSTASDFGVHHASFREENSRKIYDGSSKRLVI